jgi:hypothetical protein
MINRSSQLLENDPDALAASLMQKAHLGDGLPEIACGLISLTLAGSIVVQEILFQKLFSLLGPGFAFNLLNSLLTLGPIVMVGVASARAMKWFRLRHLVQYVGYAQEKR